MPKNTPIKKAENRKKRPSQTTGKVGVRELRAHLPRYLKWVSAGNSISILKGNQIVGRLVPPAASSADPWIELENLGLLLPALRPKQELPQAIRITGDISISDTLIEDREDRF